MGIGYNIEFAAPDKPLVKQEPKRKIITNNVEIVGRVPNFHIFNKGSTVAVIVAAAVLSFCGALSANFVTYLDL